MRNRAKILTLAMAVSLAATGCGLTGSSEKELKNYGLLKAPADEEPAPVEVVETEELDNLRDSGWDGILSGDKSFKNDGKEITIKDLPEAEDYLRTFADVDGDGEDELCIRTRVELYVLDHSGDDFFVAYTGVSNYEYPVDTEDKHGIFYHRKGAAPDHDDYKFTQLLSNGEVIVTKYSSRYDANGDGYYDENDEYFLDPDYETNVDYETWKNSEDNPMMEEPSVVWLDSKVSAITWDDCSVNPSKTISEDATIQFTLADGTVQEVVVGSYSTIQSMGYNDIDNDGEDEYVFHIYFTNTLGEHEFLHVYKIADNKVEQFFPGNTGIAEVDEHAYWETETVVEVDGALKNAIKVESYIKEDGEAKQTYDGIIYYDNGQWNEYTE